MEPMTWRYSNPYLIGDTSRGMVTEPFLEQTVGPLPQSHPNIDFRVANVREFAGTDHLLHIAFSGVVSDILQDGLHPGHPSASEAAVKAKLGDDENVESQSTVSASQEAEEYLERLRKEVPGGKELLPERDATLKFWFEHNKVDKMLQRMNVQPPETGEKAANMTPIEGAPYVTLFVNPDAVDGEKLVTADYDRVFEVTEKLNRRNQPKTDVENEEIIHAAYQYWVGANITNGIGMARTEKDAYNIPELLAATSLPPHAVERILVPPPQD